MIKFYKGKIKLKLDNGRMFADKDLEYEICELNKYLNEKYDNELKFLLTNNKSKNENDQIKLNDINRPINIQNSLLSQNTINKNMLVHTIIADMVYYAITEKEKICANNILNKIEDYIMAFFEKNKIKVDILSDKVNEAVGSSIYDEIYNKNTNEVKYFLGDVIENSDIDILQNYVFGNLIEKIQIEDKKYSLDELLLKFQNEMKYTALQNEVKRIYEVGNVANIQGINYFMEEENHIVRRNMYKVIATALYSVGRITHPIFYICDLNVNDKNYCSNIIYFKNRFKFSKNELYFFEISRVKNNKDHGDFNSLNDTTKLNDFIKNIYQYQYDLIFSVYIEKGFDLIEQVVSALCEKTHIVKFEAKLNMEAQLIYVNQKLKETGNEDLLPKLEEVIKYQNTINDGLTTKILDDYIHNFKKSYAENIFANAYKEVTLNQMYDGDVLQELNEMVGLNNFKKCVNDIVNQQNWHNFKMDLMPFARDLKKYADNLKMNYIFCGPPGVGKTMSAKILAKVLAQNNLIKNNEIVNYSSSNMMGYGRISLRDVYANAKGGLIIIDEAGQLNDDDKNALLEMTGNENSETAIILCGYDVEMQNLLNSNEGFRSRFPNVIKFDNYTVDELTCIFINKLIKKHFVINKKAIDKLKKIIQEMTVMKNFGGVRTIENLLQKVISVHSNNRLKEINEQLIKNNSNNIEIDTDTLLEISEKDLNEINLEDILGSEWLMYKKYGNPKEELDNLIGLEEIKNIVKKYLAKGKIDKYKKEKGIIKEDGLNMHLCMMGAPGTAKTTVARLIARILCEYGILATSKLIQCGIEDLVGEYVGETAPKVVKKFNEAKGGILFIDEAYALANKKAGGFNQECIDTIIKEMENHRNDVIVIFAGYKEPMMELINSNQGFKSRISCFVDFPEYTIEELLKIFYKLVKDKGYVLDNEKLIEEKVKQYLLNKKQEKNFGNGRECRLLLEKVISNQSVRLDNTKKTKYKKKELIKLLPEDFDIDTKNLYKNNVLGFVA